MIDIFHHDGLLVSHNAHPRDEIRIERSLLPCRDLLRRNSPCSVRSAGSRTCVIQRGEQVFNLVRFGLLVEGQDIPVAAWERIGGIAGWG